MTILSLANDLAGSVTFAEALDRLSAIYERLKGPHPDAADAVLAVYNNLEGHVEAAGLDRAWYEPRPDGALYRRDEALPPEFQAQMVRVSQQLRAAGLDADADALDPRMEPGLVDSLRDIASSPLGVGVGIGLAAVVALIVWAILK